MTTLAPVKPASAHMSPTKNTGFDGREPPSPAPTTLSFGPGDDRDKLDSHRSQMTRDIDRDTPGATHNLSKKGSKGDFNRKRSMKGADYYGEVFAVRETGPVIPASSGVWVELRTNVIVSRVFFSFFSQMLLGLLYSFLFTACVTCISSQLYVSRFVGCLWSRNPG